MEELYPDQEAVLQAERNLAAAKGEPYAVPVEFPVRWNVGAPCPHLVQSDTEAFLAFYLADFDPNWDGSAGTDPEKLAVVEFERCICTKMGTPDEEVLEKHPLSGSGLVGYEAMVVKNSRWVKELDEINAVYAREKDVAWLGLNHYIFPFHDSTFECVARGFKVEVFRTSMPEVLAEISKRLVG